MENSSVELVPCSDEFLYKAISTLKKYNLDTTCSVAIDAIIESYLAKERNERLLIEYLNSDDFFSSNVSEIKEQIISIINND